MMWNCFLSGEHNVFEFRLEHGGSGTGSSSPKAYRSHQCERYTRGGDNIVHLVATSSVAEVPPYEREQHPAHQVQAALTRTDQ